VLIGAQRRSVRLKKIAAISGRRRIRTCRLLVRLRLELGEPAVSGRRIRHAGMTSKRARRWSRIRMLASPPESILAARSDARIWRHFLAERAGENVRRTLAPDPRAAPPRKD
jgi:hypothetical protein